MNPIYRWYWIGRGMGWRNVPRRAGFLALRKLGAERRALPPGEATPETWRKALVPEYRAEAAADSWQQRARKFLIDPERAPAMRQAMMALAPDDCWRENVTEQVDRLEHGELKYFGRRYYHVGSPARFLYDPIHDVDWASGDSAASIDSLDARRKDIKCVWEASRFSVAFALAREYVRNAAPQASELFWRHFEAWDAQNPYGLSVNWNCSQESSLRVMAWIFAACAMLDAPASTPERLHRLTQLAWYTGRQVAFNIGYALSQQNNHVFSEATLLWTLGLLFPEFQAAKSWRDKGRRILIAAADRQIYEDGSYIQHSASYHRVMLDDSLWAMRLGELHGDPLDEMRGPISRAVRWLQEMIDPNTGRLPNYGPNDGAQVLPLSCCDYLDYRPVVQAGHYLLNRKRCFEQGIWDEQAVWLGGTEVLHSPVDRVQRSAQFSGTSGGYYTLSGPRTWGMIRATKYRDRPHQADMLHFDLWSQGTNILRDGGSFLYNGDQPWKDWFPSTAAHNTVEIDGVDQMVRGPRFLWLLWPAARVLANTTSSDGNSSVFEAEHDGYGRLASPVTHRRRIERTGDRYFVRDELLGAGKHQVALRWRLCDDAWRQSANTFSLADGDRQYSVTIGPLPSGFTVRLARGEESPRPEGWESTYYAERKPSPTIIVSGSAQLPLTLETTIDVE